MKKYESSIEVSRQALLIGLMVVTMVMVLLAGAITEMKSSIRINQLQHKALALANYYSETFVSDDASELPDGFDVEYSLTEQGGSLHLQVAHNAQGVLVTTTATLKGIQRTVQTFVPNMTTLKTGSELVAAN